MRSPKMRSKPRDKEKRPCEILKAWAGSESLDSSAVELLRGLPPTKQGFKTFNNVIPRNQRKLCKPTQRQFLDPSQIPPI